MRGETPDPGPSLVVICRGVWVWLSIELELAGGVIPALF